MPSPTRIASTGENSSPSARASSSAPCPAAVETQLRNLMPLDPNRFTRKTSEALQAAQALARSQGHTEVGSEHLLRALLDQPEGIVSGILERIGVTPSHLRGL